MTDTIHVLRLTAITNNQTEELLFATAEAADKEYNRAVAMLAKKKIPEGEFPFVAFSIKGEFGIAFTVNLLNFTIGRYDTLALAARNHRFKIAIDLAKAHHEQKPGFGIGSHA